MHLSDDFLSTDRQRLHAFLSMFPASSLEHEFLLSLCLLILQLWRR